MSRRGKIGPVQRIEMELVDAFIAQASAKIARHGGGDHAPRLDVLLEAVEQAGEPCRHLGAAQAGHLGYSLEVRDRHDARHDRRVHPRRRGAIAEAQEIVGVEEELGDAAVGAGIDLALEILQVGFGVRRIGVLLGIAGGADLERADLLQADDELGGIGVAAGMRAVLAAHAGRRIAAQRHDVSDAGIPIGPRDLVDLALGCADAGEVCRGIDTGLLL